MAADPFGVAGSRLESLTYMHRNTLLAIVIAFIATISLATILAFVWGLSALIGLFFLALAGITILLNRGKFMDYTVWIFVVLAVVFFALGFAGYTIATVDFSGIGPLKSLHQIFNG